MRPRTFTERAALNVYMEAEQLAWLKRHALASGISPSAVIRDWIDHAKDKQ